MRYLSLFSGIEAATAAWQPLGWQCVAVSDIDPFACAALAQHHPSVPNLGDITQITEEQVATLGAIDLVVFGSPCQDLSVAGKRKGLNGERSGLFFAAMRVVGWARKHGGCRFALWENVPGAFSSNDGGDFAVVVGQMAGLDSAEIPPKGWGTEGAIVGPQGMVEWSVLDAQWFGVAQRRRRVFALADFGDWVGRPPILLEPESLRGDSAPSREAGQGVAGTLASRAGAGGYPRTDEACDGHVIAAPVCPTLRAGGNKTGGDMPPGTDVDTCESLIGLQRPVLTFALQHAQIGRKDLSGQQGKGWQADVAFTQDSRSGQMGAEVTTDHSPTLNCNHEVPYVVFGLVGHGEYSDSLAQLRASGGDCGPGSEFLCVTGQITHTLKADGFDASEDGTGRGTPIVAVLPPGFVAPTLDQRAGRSGANSFATSGGLIPVAIAETETMIPCGVTIHGTHGTKSVASFSDVAQCLRARPPGYLDNSSTTVVAYGIRTANTSSNGCGIQEEVTHTLDGAMGVAVAFQSSQSGQTGRGDSAPCVAYSTTVVAFSIAENQRGEVRTADVVGALGCGGGKPGMGYPAVAFQSSQSGVRINDVHATLDSNNGPRRHNGALIGMQVRRLTPKECERLQGFPDGHTLITVRGKPAADGPRYKSLGNSMAVPVMAWIGRQIDHVVLFY